MKKLLIFSHFNVYFIIVWYDNKISLKVLEDIKMELLKIFDLSDITNILSGQYMEVLSKYLLPAAIPVFIIALVNCFLGHKVFKVLIGMAGVLIGGLLGVGMVSGIYTLSSNKLPSVGIMMLAAGIGAVIIGFFSYKLYKGGAFCMGFITGVILGIAIMKWMNKDEYIIAGVIGGLLMGLLAIDLYRHVVILLTGTNGGFVSAACLAIILKKEDPLFILKFGIVLSFIGILVQYILLFVGRKNAEDDEEEEVNIKEERQNRKRKETKEDKKEHKKITKKRKAKKNASKNKKKQQGKKGYDYEAEFFLVEIISTIAQKIKDFVVDKFDFEEDDEEDIYEDEDVLEEEEYEDEDEIKEELDEEELEEVDEKKEDDKEYADLKNYQLRKDELEKSVLSDTTSYSQIQNEDIIIEDILDKNKPVEIVSEEEEDDFDLEDLTQKLEEELNHSLEIEKDKELEDLIIKEVYKNLQ